MDKFDKFEKLDRKVEKTIHEVETMDRRKFYRNSFVTAGVWALLLDLIIETLGRFPTAGIFGGLSFFAHSPLVFLYNTLIIYTTLVLASLFKRRVFCFTIISIFWLTIGVVNGVILTQRMTPFTVKDLSILDDGLTIVTNYLSKVEIAGAILAVIVAIGLLVLLFINGPQKKDGVKRKRNLVAVVLVIAFTFLSSSFVIKAGIVETFFGNLAYAYRDYGVVYCFVNTWLNTGISKPNGYSEEEILSIFDKKELGDDNAMLLTQKDEDEEHPNILFLQLESFIDPMTIKSITLSRDPCPNFRKLLETYSSGELTVPACGAGTANVEFEVLTGLSVKFFGPGEYPYKAVLKEKTEESLAYDLDSLGYIEPQQEETTTTASATQTTSGEPQDGTTASSSATASGTETSGSTAASGTETSGSTAGRQTTASGTTVSDGEPSAGLSTGATVALIAVGAAVLVGAGVTVWVLRTRKK